MSFECEDGIDEARIARELAKPIPAGRMHYAGALSIRNARRVILIADGWAACSTGERAVAIRASGGATRELAKVTCKRCLALIAKASKAGAK